MYLDELSRAIQMQNTATAVKMAYIFVSATSSASIQRSITSLKVNGCLCHSISEVLTILPGTCTDQTWGSDACSQYCRDFSSVDSNFLDVTFQGDIRQCDNDNDHWTCGQDVTTCDVYKFEVVPGYVDDKRVAQQSPAILALPQAYTTVLYGTGDVSTTTVTVTASPSVSSDARNDSESGASVANPNCSSENRDLGLEVGLGVGLPLLFALLIALFLLYRANKKLKALDRPQHYYSNTTASHGMQERNQWTTDAMKKNVVHEAPTNGLTR
jgi:hypothetical protein